MGETPDISFDLAVHTVELVLEQCGARGNGPVVLRRYLDAAEAEITRLRSELKMWHAKVGEFSRAFEAQRAELEKARAWQGMESAPRNRPIIVRTATGRIVKVKWTVLDGDSAGWGTPEEDDPHPNCWDDGFCWASNSDEEPSDPPASWIEMPKGEKP